MKIRTQDGLITRFEARLQRFASEYIVDLCASKAAQRAGWKSPQAGPALLARIDVQQMIADKMKSRAKRLQVDGDSILYALLAQLERLSAMVGQDLAELYLDSGEMKPIREWPAVWRTRLVSGLETEQIFGTGGSVRKLKRESTLAIEKQITDVLRLIGEHVNVKAFPTSGAQLAPREAIEITIVHVGDGSVGVKVNG